MDPITAIANAAGEYFSLVSNGLDVLWGNKQKLRLERERTKQVEELTEQERIRYDQLIASGNDEQAALLLLAAQQRQSGSQTTTYIVLGGLMIAVVLIILLKARKK